MPPHWIRFGFVAACFCAAATAAPPKPPAMKAQVRCWPCCNAEFVSDLKFANTGKSTIPRGWTIEYWFPGGQDRSLKYANVPRDIAPGGEFILRSAVNAMPAQTECRASAFETWHFSYTLSPHAMTLMVGEEKDIRLTVDHLADSMYQAVTVYLRGPAGVVSLNGVAQSQVQVSFYVPDGKLTIPVRVKGLKAGGPVQVFVKDQYLPPTGQTAAISSCSVTVKEGLALGGREGLKH